MKRPKIGIVYVPFNNNKHLPTVFTSWSNLKYPKENLHIYIATNINTENCIELINQLSEKYKALLPEITLINDGKNDGFAGNHNKCIKLAIEDGCDYVFLNNGDLYLHEDAIAEALAVAETDQQIATVQSVCLYWHDHEKINVAGGAIHIAGHGYAMQNGDHISQLPSEPREVSYTSFAAVLIRTSILQHIGLIEEGFFMYHDDLEFCLRARVAGHKNYLAPKSLAYHDYQFGRNPQKFAWMETNRYIVTFAYYKLPTLIFLMPILIGVEIMSWLFSIRGGWFKARVNMVISFTKLKNWRLIFAMRAKMHRLRKVSDRYLLKFVTGKILGQETNNFIVEKISNPLLEAYVRILRFIIIW
jgi:GT2 family glycosyltransferase